MYIHEPIHVSSYGTTVNIYAAVKERKDMNTIKNDIAEAYDKGMDDFREFIKKLYGMTNSELIDLYYENTPEDVICNTTYTSLELMSMYNVWSNKHRIKVGDEIHVELPFLQDNLYVWIYKIDKSNSSIYAIDYFGNNYYITNEKFTKTGRHCDDIPKLFDILKSLQRIEGDK